MVRTISKIDLALAYHCAERCPNRRFPDCLAYFPIYSQNFPNVNYLFSFVTHRNPSGVTYSRPAFLLFRMLFRHMGVSHYALHVVFAPDRSLNHVWISNAMVFEVDSGK